MNDWEFAGRTIQKLDAGAARDTRWRYSGIFRANASSALYMAEAALGINIACGSMGHMREELLDAITAFYMGGRLAPDSLDFAAIEKKEARWLSAWAFLLMDSGAEGRGGQK